MSTQNNLPKLLAVLVIALIVAACSAPAPTAAPTATAVPAAANAADTGGADAFQVVMVQSVITTGPGRFAVGLMNGNAFVKNAKLSMTFYDLTGGQPTQILWDFDETHNFWHSTPPTTPSQASEKHQAASLPVVYREAPDGIATMYTIEINFPNAGSWGVAVEGATTDGKPVDQKVSFDVLASSPELAVGQKAPSVKTHTISDVNNNLKLLTSAPTPNPGFYQLSLDQALTNGKPSLVQFSTPAFCTSRLCGPAYDVLSQAYGTYSSQVNFIQVEIYSDLPNPDLTHPHLAAAMTAWHLTTEPWTYLLDKNGVVVWRVEGLVTVDEVHAAVDQVLKG